MKETKSITERILTFEDAQKETGRPNVPDFSNVPTDLLKYFTAQYKMVVIAEALNEKWKADWNNSNQEKWFPWFRMSSSGFVFDGTDYYCTDANAGDGSRLCFKNEEIAEYAGEHFIDIWKDILAK